VGADVLESGPQRPAGMVRRRVRRALRSLRERLARLGPRSRRAGAVSAAVLLAVAALAALRASLPEQAAPSATAISAAPRVLPYGELGGPPYDTLPSRTPIPVPSLVSEDGQTVGGELPLFAPAPSEQAARIAVELVLGRYCRQPAAHLIELEQGVGESWRSVTAVVSQARFPLSYWPVITLHLTFTGYTYRWRGSLAELRACP
jgi:hypothetical protein